MWRSRKLFIHERGFSVQIEKENKKYYFHSTWYVIALVVIYSLAHNYMTNSIFVFYRDTRMFTHLVRRSLVCTRILFIKCFFCSHSLLYGFFPAIKAECKNLVDWASNDFNVLLFPSFQVVHSSIVVSTMTERGKAHEKANRKIVQFNW